MTVTYDLAQLDWQLSGWHPWYWVGALAHETELTLYGDVPPMPARVPGSVQGALREAGLLPDWNEGVRSRECEWVENRHWCFATTLPAEWTASPGRKVLRCEGLDYQGTLLVNGRRAGDFVGSYTPHEFDLTDLLQEGENRLEVVFTDHPRALGQVQYTSQIREMKPRFYYIWDWVPRLMQVGIWDRVSLEVRGGDAVTALRCWTDYDAEAGIGTLYLEAALALEAARALEVVVEGAEGVVGSLGGPLGDVLEAEGEEDFEPVLEVDLADLPVRAWWPNGAGKRELYTVTLRLLDGEGAVLEEAVRRVGFRQVRWLPCEGAPEDAAPWICEVNGRPLFLQGVNWVPIRPNLADVTEEDYRLRLELYRDLGCNLLRIWGGAVLEREPFYRLCDELGLLVWQEFPLSSSGLDNWPPEDPEVMEELVGIAETYIARRQHHPSLLLWCGGNELQGGFDGNKAGIGKPVDGSHPLMQLFAAMLEELDPTRRFLPTSSTGPRFMAEAAEFGQGLHHDVHGPWNHAGDLATWYEYWDGDDALFRSETGMPGAQDADLTRQYGGELALPGDRSNPYWMHTGGWWIQWEDYLAQGGDAGDLEAYVRWSQERQAMALAYAARACKRRFPRCGGFVMWMGHDCYPCPANTAIVDYRGRPKPAARAVAEVFRARPEELG